MIPAQIASDLAVLSASVQAAAPIRQASPILKESDPAVRAGRLALAQLTEQVLVQGLTALGVNAPQQM